MSTASRKANTRASLPGAVASVARGSLLNLYRHWVLALFSLVAAFGTWFVIQDVENPRVTASYPLEGAPPSILVRAVNTDHLVPNSESRVSVEVEGREGDLVNLSDDDFEATIDVKGIPANTPTEVQVRVVSRRDGVKVLAVSPATISVTMEPLVEAEFEVRLSPSGQLATGFEVTDQKIEPLTVKVSGLQDRIDNVVSVELDVNLSALREGSNVFEGELRARSLTGGEVAVTNLSPERGKVTYTVRQAFVQRSIPVAVTTTGQVAPGYHVTSVIIEPPVISVSGPADKMASLNELRTEPIPLTNATSEIRLTRNIDVQQENLSLERRQVSVRIEVKPIECPGGAAASPCGAVLLQLAPVPTDQPSGLVITSVVRVSVQLTGPLPELDKLTPKSITATVSLAGGLAGPGLYPVTVSVPPNLQGLGIRAEQPAPIPVTLGTGP